MNLKEYQKNLDKLLVYNVNFNKVEEVRDLIYRGANVDAKNEEGVPVLALAAEKGQMVHTPARSCIHNPVHSGCAAHPDISRRCRRRLPSGRIW